MRWLRRRHEHTKELIAVLPALWPYLDDESRAAFPASAGYAADVSRLAELQASSTELGPGSAGSLSA